MIQHRGKDGAEAFCSTYPSISRHPLYEACEEGRSSTDENYWLMKTKNETKFPSGQFQFYGINVTRRVICLFTKQHYSHSSQLSFLTPTAILSLGNPISINRKCID